MDIFKEKNGSLKFINIFSLRFILTNFKNQTFIVHNMILSKKWFLIITLLKIKKCKVFYHEHGTAWSSPKKNKLIYKKRISKINKVIVNSNATKLLLEKIYGIKDEIQLLRSPICIYEELNKKIKKLEMCSNRKINEVLKIGFIGRLEAHKNPQFLIHLSKNLKENFDIDSRLHFVGSGTAFNSLKRLCLEMKVEAKFHGRVPSRRLICEEWDFCIVPSIREPLGLVPGEMSFFNLLTFSSNVDGLSELYPESCQCLLIKCFYLKIIMIIIVICSICLIKIFFQKATILQLNILRKLLKIYWIIIYMINYFLNIKNI